MKAVNILLFLFSLILSSPLTAQSDDSVGSRKGRWLIEQGTNAQGLFESGLSIFVLNIDAGKFVTNDLALKLKANLTFGDSENTTFGAAAKYYIGGRVPLEIGGLYNTQSEEFLLNPSLGYAIPLASNIYLEPGLGILTDTEFSGVIYNPKIVFALLF